MIVSENSIRPSSFSFDIAICSVGYEKRGRFIVETLDVEADYKIAIEFGFLRELSYSENLAFFEKKGWQLKSLRDDDLFNYIVDLVSRHNVSSECRIFIDISSMSREMMAKLVVALNRAVSSDYEIELTVGYAPSEFSGDYQLAPIRVSGPVVPDLAGWTSRPDRPLGVIMGLGCEPGLALGSLQLLEPSKSWLFSPSGFDPKFFGGVRSANAYVEDIFDVTQFEYSIDSAFVTRCRIEALMNSLEPAFRLLCVPFGPKIFAWLCLATVVFQARNGVGVWSFSSKEQAIAVDRGMAGDIVWYTCFLRAQTLEERSSDV